MKNVVVEGLSDALGATPAEAGFLICVEVREGHEDVVTFSEVGQLANGCSFTGLFALLGQCGLEMRVQFSGEFEQLPEVEVDSICASETVTEE